MKYLEKMRKSQHFYFILGILTLTLLISGHNVNAQQNIAAATLSGTVEDGNGAIISGCKITATQMETNQQRTTQSDENGRFRFSYLPVGTYVVKAEQNGFAILNREIILSVGQSVEMPLQLSVAERTEQVSISTDTALIETARTQLTETIMPRDVENLPLNGRNYLDLALLIPGVSRTNTGSVQRFAETSSVPGTGISIAGQRNLNNSFIVDGSSANDDAAELAGTYYSQEVIREFQVVTSGGVAEFGRASAGFVNILTQSGTNDWRGKLYGFFRDDKLDARNPLSFIAKDQLTQTQYGANFGGPIRRDKMFFFTNFEQTRRNDSTAPITISPANVATINNRLNQVNFRGPRIITGIASGGYDITNFFARVDTNITSKNLFTVTYNFYDILAVNSRTVGGLNDVSRGTNLDNQDHTINLNNVTTISSNSLNEFRFQYRRSRLAAPPNDLVGPAVNITGVASFGIATFSPLERDIDLYQASDSYSTVFGNHALKVGGEFIFNKVNIFFPGAFEGVYNFTSLNNFLAGNYSTYQQAFGVPSQAQNNPNFGVFVQDEWKPRPDLTFNLGLRYDLQLLPDPIQTDNNNISPRFGVAYSPGDRNTVIRASFGLYYDRIPLRATSNALQRDGSKYLVTQLTPTAPGAPVFPNVLSARPSSLLTKPNITRIDPEIENSNSTQANLQIERLLPWNASVSVGYLYLRARNLILSRNANVPRCASSVDPINLCRPDPNFGNIGRFEGSGDSDYNGLLVSFNKRASDWATVRVSYTFSKSLDNAGNFFFSAPQNNFDLRDDRGLSDNDQRHRLTLSGTLNSRSAKEGDSLWRKVAGGFQFSYIFSYASHLPFNILTGNDRNGDTNFNDRPVGVARNAGRGFDFASLDLRLSRRFRFTERVGMELLVEGFNVLNRSNFSVPNNVRGTGATPLASFGRPTVAFDPRQVQLGFRLNF